MAPDKLVKTLIYTTDQGAIGVLVKGDREMNEIKLGNLLGLDWVELADEKTIEKVTGGPLGFSGPIGLTSLSPPTVISSSWKILSWVATNTMCIQ